MMQSRTHNCGELHIDNVGESVTLVGWLENMREVGSGLGFVVLRDFYGTTQIVLDSEEMVKTAKAINKESTISVKGTVRERSSKNPKQETGDIEVVPESIDVLGRCRYNELPFEINHSREADEYKNGHIPGSINLPVEEIQSVEAVIADKEIPVYVYCLSGGRAQKAVTIMKTFGYKNVRNIGGIKSYKGMTIIS